MGSFIVIYLLISAAVFAATVALWVFVLRLVWRDAHPSGGLLGSPHDVTLLSRLRRLTHQHL